jgi:hypothetical protein
MLAADGAVVEPQAFFKPRAARQSKSPRFGSLPGLPPGYAARWERAMIEIRNGGSALDTVAPLPGEESLYGQFRVLLDAAAKDSTIKQALVQAAVEPERQVIAPFLGISPLK